MRATKRDQIIDAALELFYRNGFNATGIEKVLSDADVARMTLYNHFKSKEDLILAVLRRRDERFRDWLARYVAQHGDTPRAQLLALFDAHAAWFREDGFRGCMFINAAAEFSGSSEAIHTVAADHKRQITRLVRDLAVAAGAKDAEALADQISLLLDGAIVNAQVLGDAEWAAKARAAAEVLIDRG